MARIDRLPDDWLPPTWGLQLLTGTADEWENFGFVDGWNWVAGGQQGSVRDSGYAAYVRRVEASGLNYLFGKGKGKPFEDGWWRGVRAAEERERSPARWKTRRVLRNALLNVLLVPLAAVTTAAAISIFELELSQWVFIPLAAVTLGVVWSLARPSH